MLCKQFPSASFLPPTPTTPCMQVGYLICEDSSAPLLLTTEAAVAPRQRSSYSSSSPHVLEPALSAPDAQSTLPHSHTEQQLRPALSQQQRSSPHGPLQYRPGAAWEGPGAGPEAGAAGPGARPSSSSSQTSTSAWRLSPEQAPALAPIPLYLGCNVLCGTRPPPSSVRAQDPPTASSSASTAATAGTASSPVQLGSGAGFSGTGAGAVGAAGGASAGAHRLSVEAKEALSAALQRIQQV